MQRLSPLSLQGLRAVVRPEYADMGADDLEQLVEDAVGELPAESAEGLMSALGSVGKAVAPTLQRAAPGIVQGAASGATVGGPWGALIGAGAGLASSAMSGKRAPGRPIASAVSPTAPVTPPEIRPLPSGPGAAATLLGLMQNPMVQHAILSQVLGAAGGSHTPIGAGMQIPRGAINNLLMQLLASASESLSESEAESDDSYLRDQDGEYLADPASPEQQAAVVLARMNQAAGEGDSMDDSLEWAEEEGITAADGIEFAEELESVDFY